MRITQHQVRGGLTGEPYFFIYDPIFRCALRSRGPGQQFDGRIAVVLVVGPGTVRWTTDAAHTYANAFREFIPFMFGR